MEVTTRYKQTEVGVIPFDWELKKLGDEISFQGGSQPPLTTFINNYKEGYIRLLQIRDYKTDKYQTYVPLNLAKKFCEKDDIMIGRYGPPIFQILYGLEGAYNVALIKAIPSKNILKQYAYYFLKQNPLFDFVEKLSQRSSGQTGIDLKELRAYPLPLPKISEQTAIATALSDADALISSLEKLIAKKRNIKQGAMQQLLQPKEGWEVKKIAEFAPLQRGFDLPNTQILKGNFPVVFSNGIGNYHSKYQVAGPGIITGRSGTIGKVFYVPEDYWPHNTTLWVTSFKNCYPKFVYYLFLHIGLSQFATGTGVPTLNRNDVHDFKVYIPKTVQEQKMIAIILDDMEAEIATLETKLEKYKQIKQGMMQQLLTGKIRLV